MLWPRDHGRENMVGAAAMQQLIDDLPEQVALLADDFTVVAANRAWLEEMDKLGYAELSPGGNYMSVAREQAAAGYEPATEAVAALEEIAAGTRAYFQFVFNGRGEWSNHKYQISYHRVTVAGRPFITVNRFELTEILELRRMKDEAADFFVEGQTAERERMGRELHDSTSQQLALVTVMLGRIKRISRNARLLGLLEDVQEVVRETQEEIRSISYLARPPGLQSAGLGDALKSLVEAFGRRSRLVSTFEIEGKVPALPEGIEEAFFRVAQEALANIQRHAKAKMVRLLLRRSRSCLHLLIADDGCGISRETLAGIGRAGVGLSSMRSRLAEIHGRLTIRALSPGTAILASHRLDGLPAR
jgi:signal transduction histidine kinase